MLLMGIWIQTHIFYSADLSWPMHVGERLLTGGNYTNNFFDVSPPMVFYLFLPAVFISKVFMVPFYVSLPIYEFSLVLLSLAFCRYFLIRLYPQKNFIYYVWLITLAFTFIFLPTHELGQREHVLILLALPYFLLTALRVEKQTANIWMLVCVGVMAGIGFNIKPYFLLTWVALESYLFYKNKNWRIFFRTENNFILLVSAIYAVSIIVITPDYLTVVLPIVTKFYYAAYKFPLLTLLETPASLCSLGLIAASFLLGQNTTPLFAILRIAAITFLIIALMQQTIWYYHFYPAMAVSFLLVSILFSLKINEIVRNSLRYPLQVILAIFSGYLLLCPVLISANTTMKSLASRQDSIRNSMIKLINQYPNNKYVYFLSDLITPLYPILDYTHAESASRFSSLWMILNIYPSSTRSIDSALIPGKNFFIHAVVTDLTTKDPGLIFVEQTSVDWPRFNINVDFIKFFSQDPRFLKFWQRYKYLETIGNYKVFLLNNYS